MVSRRGEEGREPGLEPLHIDGPLKAQAEASGESVDQELPLLAGQVLPQFDPEDPLADVLYGYDAYAAETEQRERPKRQVHLQIEEFDPGRHITGTEQSEGSHGKNAQFRKDQKRGRTDEGS
jgi:hypothetical protein